MPTTLTAPRKFRLQRKADFEFAIRTADVDAERSILAAEYVLQEFEDYYFESRAIPQAAKAAFENRDWEGALYLSRRRLSLYSRTVHTVAARLKRAFPELETDDAIWAAIEAHYVPLTAGRYEEDFALAFIKSTHRVMFASEWHPVEYGIASRWKDVEELGEHVVRTFPALPRFDARLVRAIIDVPAFSAPFQDADRDCQQIAARLNRDYGLESRQNPFLTSVRIVNAGFYRNRGAYIVGQAMFANATTRPLIVGFENDAAGIRADAVLTGEADAHNLFSSTLANFHVTNTRYHELAAFLHSIMPRRPLGLHYSTIGFNHVGKVAVLRELEREIGNYEHRFETAVGFRGTVAIGFSAPSSNYVLKIVRDRPTRQYKWGVFPGIDAVLAKYRRVHEINRTGSMLDNMIFQNIALESAWFDHDLLTELVTAASQTVSFFGDKVGFRHLIVQPKMTPLPVYLETAGTEEALQAMDNLGHCIKNNAAANIFNKDLDARNYGVSRFGKVFLFDYDAVEPLSEVKIRTNSNRVDGEEDIPDWFFEDGTIFLPEEIDVGMGIAERDLIRHFRARHRDLLTVGYWEGMQRALAKSYVPKLHVYPARCRLGAEP